MLTFRYQFTETSSTSSSFNGNTRFINISVSLFGLTFAPRVFTKVMKPVVGTLQHMGIRLIIYLDDILILHQSKEELIQLIPMICQMFEALGLVVNQKKSKDREWNSWGFW